MHFNFEHEIVLENEAVRLQPISILDFEHLLPVALEDTLMLQYSPQQVYSRELLSRYIEAAIILRARQSRYSFSIFSKAKQTYAGSTAYLNVFNEDKRMEIGATWIGRSFRGSGLNQQCKQLLLEYAFENTGACRVEFRTDERNLQSRRAIEKIGGRLEGILREHMVLHDGCRRNTCYYSILKKEWASIKNKL